MEQRKAYYNVMIKQTVLYTYLHCTVCVLHWEIAEGLLSPVAKCTRYPWRRHASEQCWTINEIKFASASPRGESKHLYSGSQAY